MEVGHIAWFNESQGYGYITHRDGREVYFHYTGVQGSENKRGLIMGAEVHFNLIETTGGLEAFNVQKR